MVACTPRKVLIAGALVAGLLAVGAPAHAAPGDLDASFSGDGIQLMGFGGSSDGGSGVALQGDGRIVVAGTTLSYDDAGDYISEFALARLTADGSLDMSFSGDGRQTTGFGAGTVATAHGVAIQPDGKVVVAGSVRSGVAEWDFGLARYQADGSLDTSFAGDGTVTTDLGGRESGWSVAVQGDRIVVAGSTSGGLALARYRADGSLDDSFSGDGTVTTALGGSGYSVAIQADGKIVVAGGSGLARFLADGSLDSSFSGDGTVPLDAVGARSVALQADGRIVVAGAIVVEGELPHNDFALLRYNADGALDSSFGSGGMQTTDFGGGYAMDDVAAAVALQPDGKIVAVGGSTPVDWVWEGSAIALARYAADGSLDASFADGGKRVTMHGLENAGAAVALQGDGKIVVAGSGSDPGDGASLLLVARYEGDAVAANVAPVARFAFSCSGRVCDFDGSGSSDPDGSIAGYRWEFGDGTSADSGYARKVFAQYGTYSVRLTVTDNDGATGARAETITLLRLTARGTLVRGLPRVELSWNGSAGTLYYVYRGSARVAAVTATAFTDRPPVSASRTYSYTVCQAAGPYCTATETVRVP